MTYILIKEANRDRLAKALAEGETGARTRLMGVDQLTTSAEAAEGALDPMLKKDRPGVTAYLNAGYAVPNSYRGSARQTEVFAERGSGGWALVKVVRGAVPNVPGGSDGRPGFTDLVVTEQHVQSVLNAWLTRPGIRYADESGSISDR